VVTGPQAQAALEDWQTHSEELVLLAVTVLVLLAVQADLKVIPQY